MQTFTHTTTTKNSNRLGRLLTIALVALLSTFSTLNSHSQTVLFENFESATFPPTGWTVINAGSGNNWTRSTATSSPVQFTGSTAYMRYSWNTANAANTWAITSGVSLTGGVTYTISFQQAASGFAESMRVTVGTAQTVAAQTTTLLDLPSVSASTYTKRTTTFTPVSSGTYYFGFQCYSIADQFNLAIDEIEIKVPVTADAAPTSFTATALSQTGMTIGWTDNSTNETAFRLYRSTDNVTFAQVGSDIASTTSAGTGTTYSSVQTGLIPGITYYYRIAAVADAESAYLTGSQATNAAGVKTASTGNWSVAGTWSPSGVPTVTDNVVIPDGVTVTVDNTAATCLNLTVGQGVSGALTWSTSAASTLTVVNDVTIAAGATVSAPASGTSTKQFNIGGSSATAANTSNLTVNGTLNLVTSATVFVSTTFFGSVNSTLSGSGATANFYTITVNKGNSINSVLDVTRVITSLAPTASGSRLVLTNGTFKLSSASTLTPYFGSQTICSAPARLWLNNAAASVQCVGTGTGTGAGSPTVTGVLQIDNGTFGYGSGNNILTFTSGSGILNMSGGILNHFGAVSFPSSAGTQFNMSGGNFNVDVQAVNSTTTTAFTIGASTTVNWSGGTVTLIDPPASSGFSSWSASSGGAKSITGGTLRIGDGTSTTTGGAIFNTSGFGISSSMPVWNLEIDNRTDAFTSRMARIGGTTVVLNNLDIKANGYLFTGSGASGNTIIFNGPALTNAGTLAGTHPTGSLTVGTVQFSATSGTQTVSGAGSFLSLGALSIANAGTGVNFSQDNQFNTLRINMFQGNVTGAGKITLGLGAATASVVQYGQTGGTVAAGNFDVAPTYNIGSGGLTVSYLQETALRTTGFEIPPARTVVGATINNTNGVTLAGGPLTLTGTLTLTNGVLTTSSANLLTITGTTTGSISGGSAACYINGPVVRTLPASLASGSTYTFPVGKGSYNPFELVNPTTNASGTVAVSAEVFDANAGGTPGTLMGILNTSRYWAASITSGGANFTNSLIRLNDTRGTQDAIAASTTLTGAYDHIGGIASTLAAGSITTTAPAVTGLAGYFLMGNLGAASLSNLNITPSGTQCTNVARTVTVTATPGGAAVTGVVINYNINGVAQTAITMTNTGGDNWSGVIPTVTPANANVTWSVTATDANSLTSSANGTGYADEPLNIVTVTAAASVNPVCSASATVLTGTIVQSGVSATLGAGATNSTSTAASFMPGGWGGAKTQYIVRASELTAAGLTAGALTSLQYEVNTVGQTYQGFTVQIGTTAQTAMTTTLINSGLTQVYKGTLPNDGYLPVEGVNTLAFGTGAGSASSFNWDGSSNIVISICWSLVPAATTSTATSIKVDATSPSFTCSAYEQSDSETPANMCGKTLGDGTGTSRPKFTFNKTPLAYSAFSWSDGSTEVATTNPATINPTETKSYTLTVTETATGCTKVSNAVEVAVTPLPAAPTGIPSLQCGTGNPEVAVVGGVNGQYRWYLTPTGGTALAGHVNDTLDNYPISIPTTFYVSIFDGTCESNRTAVLADVIAPDAVTANADFNAVCANNAEINLSITQTGSNQDYSFTWTASPEAGSGITGSVSGAPVTGLATITPTVAGTYVYTVTAIDGSCTTTDTIWVLVKALPAIDSISASPTPICAGVASTLNVYSAGGYASTGLPAPTGYCTATYSNTTEDDIGQVTFAGINNPAVRPTPQQSNAAAANTYTDFTGITPAVVTPGNSYPFTLYHFHGTTDVTANFANVYIDFNRNGVFTDAGESFSLSKTTFLSDFTGTIAIPANASGGLTRMRVVLREGAITTPCGTIGSWGEAEDYLVDILARPTQNTALTYEWDNGAGSTSSVSVSPLATTLYTATVTDPATSCFDTAQVELVVNQLPPAPTGNNSDQCGSIVPLASVISNSGAETPTFIWYSQETGGTALQTSTSATYTTVVSATTDFYVTEVSAEGCESEPRTLVTVTVNDPDALSAAASDQVICPNTSTDISSSYTPDFNNFSVFTLTASPEAGSGITNPVSLTANGTGSDPFTVTPTLAGTYTYTITAVDPDKECTSSDTVIVVVNGLPTGISAAASNDSVCTGSTVNLTGNAASTSTTDTLVALAQGFETFPPASWTFVNAGSGNSFVASSTARTGTGAMAYNYSSFSPADAWSITPGQSLVAGTTYTLRFWYRTASIGGSFPEKLRVTVGNLATVAAQTNVLWNNNGAANLVNETYLQATINYTPTVSGTYYFGFNCYSDADENVLYIDDVSLTSVSVTQTSTFSWSSVPAGFTSSVQNPTAVVVNETTQFIVTATNPNGCSDTASVTVAAIPLPDGPIATNSTQCGLGIPTASVATGGANGSFAWYDAPTGGALLQSGGTSYNGTITATTIFYVSENDGTCESLRTPVTATVTEAPALEITPSAATTLCLGASLGLEAIGSGYVNYSWSVNPSTGAGLSATNTAAITATPTVAGTYTIVVNANDDEPAGCANTDTIIITVNPVPVIDSVTANPATICVGASSDLVAFVTAPTNTLFSQPFESFPVGNFTTSGSGVTWAGSSTYFIQGAGSMKSTYSANANASLAMNTDVDLSATINPKLQFSHICASEPGFDYGRVEYSVDGGANWLPIPASAYTGSGTLASGVSPNIGFHSSSYAAWSSQFTSSSSTYPAAPATALWRTETISLADFTAATSFRVRFRFTADESVNYAGWSIDDFKIVSDVANSINWLWNPGSISSGNSLTVSPVDTTTYTVTATYAATSCSSTVSSVVVNVTPVGASATATDSTICIGASTTLSANATGANVTYAWSDGSATVYPATASISVSPTATTNYTVTVTDACDNSTTSSVEIVVNALPTVSVDQSYTAVCSPASVALTSTTNAASPVGYQWLNNATDIGGQTASGYSAAATGVYAVRVTDGVTGCSNTSDTVTVVVNPLPAAIVMNPTSTTVCNGASITLTAKSGSSGSGTVGTGTVSNTGTSATSPYKGWYGGHKVQFLYTQAELTAAGIAAGTSISSLAMNVTNTTAFSGPFTYNGFTISMKNTASTSLTSTPETGTTTVLGPVNYTLSGTAPFTVTHNLANAFVWDGSSNLVVEFCFNNANGGGVQANTANVASTTITGRTTYFSADNNANVCASASGWSTSSTRVNMTFGYNNFSPITWNADPSLNTTVGDTVIATPTAQTTYTATATTSAGCSLNNTVTITPVYCAPVWTGAVSTSWDVPANWSSNVVPTAIDSITIGVATTGFYPLLTADKTIGGTLTINTGATLAIGGNTLTVDKGIVSDGGTLTGSATSNLTLGATSSVRFAGGAGATIKNLNVNAGVATLQSPLDITGGAGAANNNTYGTVTVANGASIVSNGNLTFKSNASGSARLAQGSTTGGWIVGNVTVERYIPGNAQRAWRMLSIPTKGTQTIKQAWQEGAATGSANPKPGFGTLITSDLATYNSVGFDGRTAKASMQFFNGTTGAWVNVTSTLASSVTTPKIESLKGYSIFIRGDRTAAINGSVTQTTPTTLRTTGTLYTGDQPAMTVLPNKFDMIGNNYVSAINYTALPQTGLSNVFYLWDPKLMLSNGSLGGYVTFSGTNSFIPTPSNSSYGTTPNTVIQAGESFFVVSTATGGTISLLESAKVAGNGVNMFRPTGAIQRLITNLYSVAGASAVMADANVTVFDNAYSNDVDGDDAIKLPNGGENFAITRNNNNLVVEGRKYVTEYDTTYFRMWNMEQHQYKLELIAENMNVPGLTGYLVDNFTGTSTALNLAGTTEYNFSVSSDAQSASNGRFKIVYRQVQFAPVPVTFISLNASLNGAAVKVDWKVAAERGVQRYEIERSADGNNFIKIGAVTAAGSTSGELSYTWLDATPLSGVNFYRIKSVDISGDVKYTYIVKVLKGNVKPAFTIAPNPVQGSVFNLQFKDQQQGRYMIRLLSNSGATIFTKVTEHPGGNGTQVINLPASIARGSYQLEIISPDKTKEVQNLFINTIK